MQLSHAIFWSNIKKYSMRYCETSEWVERRLIRADGYNMYSSMESYGTYADFSIYTWKLHKNIKAC